jgi:Xaa-Pro aminopeptidase
MKDMRIKSGRMNVIRILVNVGLPFYVFLCKIKIMIATDKRKLLEIALPDESFFLLIGKSQTRRNGDVFYPFRQNSDILLLTEISSPEMIFLAFKRNNITEFYLFSDPLSDHEKLWGTARLSYEEMSEISSLTSIAPLDACDEFLTEICDDIRMVYATHETFNRFFEGRVSPESWSSLAVFLEPLRMKKCETEIDAIRRSIDITHEAFEIIKKNL